jgi:hypothetical protein
MGLIRPSARRLGRQWAIWALPLLVLAGCQSKPKLEPQVVELEMELEAEWEGLVEDRDVSRLDQIDTLWSEVLSEARKRGHGKRLSAEGPLLDPQAALPRPAPTPGTYRCRTIKFDPAGERGGWRSYKPFYCYVGVDDNRLTLTKQTGSERPSGYLYDDGDRLVFLGSIATGEDEPSLPYGASPDQDAVGVLERVANFRYRLVLPLAPGGSRLTVLELVPSEVQPEG